MTIPKVLNLELLVQPSGPVPLRDCPDGFFLFLPDIVGVRHGPDFRLLDGTPFWGNTYDVDARVAVPVYPLTTSQVVVGQQSPAQAAELQQITDTLRQVYMDAFGADPKDPNFRERLARYREEADTLTPPDKHEKTGTAVCEEHEVKLMAPPPPADVIAEALWLYGDALIECSSDIKVALLRAIYRQDDVHYFDRLREKMARQLGHALVDHRWVSMQYRDRMLCVCFDSDRARIGVLAAR